MDGVTQVRNDASLARRGFWALWAAVLLLKLMVAARLPLFVDEAFYWQEGRHLAAAYSDLPGLTAWLTRLGVAMGGEHAFALRAPFLFIAALVPLLMVQMTTRELGERYGWQAGCFALLLPLAGTLGLLALPDAVMALATLLCVDAGAKLLREVSAAAALELALGLSLGALSHYRFIAVIGVGFFALLMLADGRRALRDVRVWIAIAFGASAWAPLVAWNVGNADAGLRFQLVERHPWAFHADGILFIAIQALLVTPLLFAALAQAGWRGRHGVLPSSRYFALLGGLVVLGFFGLGFFADTERVSFHWPLPGYLALLPLLPGVLAGWPRALRVATWLLAGIGLLATLALLRRRVHARSPHTQCGGEVVSVQLRRLARTCGHRATSARANAGGHPHSGRQLQGRRRARLCTGRSEYSGARPPAQPQTRPCAAATFVGAAARRPNRLVVKTRITGGRDQRGFL